MVARKWPLEPAWASLWRSKQLLEPDRPRWGVRWQINEHASIYMFACDRPTMLAFTEGTEKGCDQIMACALSCVRIVVHAALRPPPPPS